MDTTQRNLDIVPQETAEQLRERVVRSSVVEENSKSKYDTVKEKISGILNNPELHTGLDSIFNMLEPIKPFTTARLLRSLFDAPTVEHFIYGCMCLVEVHSAWLPKIEDISVDAMHELYLFAKRALSKVKGTEGNESILRDEMTPEAFVRKDEGPSPSLEKLCRSMGLDVNEQVGLFEKLEIPLYILSGFLGLLSFFCGDKLIGLFFAPKTIANHIARSAKLIKDSMVCWQTLEKEVEIFLDFVASFFGMSYISEKNLNSKRAMEKISTMRDDFTQLRESIKNDLTSIIQSETGVKDLEAKVKELERDIDKLQKEGVNTNIHHGYLVQFTNQIKHIKEVIIDTKSSLVGKQHPTVLYISGASGIGKSMAAKYIISQLCEKEGRLLSVYTRNSVGDGFWSGYLHQDVVVYDDYGQDRDNIDHSEMIGIFTCAAYKLSLSESLDKGRPFTSRYVIVCSNQPYIMNSVKTNDLVALNRRRHFHMAAFSPAVTNYQRDHGVMPPRDHPIWQRNCSHIRFDRYTLWDDGQHDTLLEHGVPLDTIIDEMYNLQCALKQDYINDIEEGNAMRERFSVIRAEQEAEQHAEQQQEERPQVQIDVNPNLEQVRFIPNMEPQSVVTRAEGCNQFLLLGPSGCGKSRLMEKNQFVKVFNLSDIKNENNSLKVPKDAFLHMEDISITVDATNRALEVCQFLYDNNVFEGNIVYTANPTMLMKNLMSRGEEATELFTRRCKVYKIEQKTNYATVFKNLNATKLGTQTKYTWDDLYGITHGTQSMKLSELELILLNQARCIRTYAVLDDAAIQDFHQQQPLHLHLPELTFKTFDEMADRADMAKYLTSVSLFQAMRHLYRYLPAFQMLPRAQCSPLHLINTINKEQLRLPEDLPSVQLNCKDFNLMLINHQTYFLACLTTPNFKIPPIEFASPQISVDPERKGFFQLVCKFASVLMGGVLITRELLGFNQGKKIKLISEDADGKLWKVQPESRQGKTRKANHRSQVMARSQMTRPKKDDPSPGALSGSKQIGHLQNESRKIVYDLEPKQEAKFKTFTDLAPRLEIPAFKNQIDVDGVSLYHPNHFDHIYQHHLAEVPTITLLKEFDIHISANKLDATFYNNDLNFLGLTEEKDLFFTKLISLWQSEMLQPEAMQDQQAAQIIPLVEKNQVFLYSGSTLVQRGLMVNERIGVATAHGLEESMTVQIPSSGVHYKFKIIESKIEKDIAIFQLEKSAPSFRDIRKFIRSIDDVDNLDGCDACFVTVHKRGNNMLVSQIRASKVETRKEIRYNQRKIFGYFYAGTVTGFDLPVPTLTEKGYCGSPGIILNTKYNRKIISIHSAGSEYNAFGLPIYKEMFEPKFQPESEDSVEPIFTNELDELKPIPIYSIGEFKARFELLNNNSCPVKTDIFRSPLQSKIFGDNFEPAILATYDSRNVDTVDIQSVTIEKWSHKQPEKIDEDLLEYCADSWADYYSTIIKLEKKKQFVLTKTEAINRTTFYSASQPVAKDTSPGYPWKCRKGSVGKRLYIEARQHKNAILNCIIDDKNGRDLHHAIDGLINNARQGKRSAVVFSSSAKDEVIKKSKIYPCRTRGFAGSPLHFYLALKMYTNTATCALIETRKKTPVKLGIVANQDEWNDLHQWLASNSTIGLDLDFKDWDAKIPLKFMQKLSKIYNAIYSAYPADETTLEEDNAIRTGLYKCLEGPLLTLGQTVVQAPGGQVSGQPNTTPDNCLVHCMFILYAWMKLAPEDKRNFNSFLDNVRLAVFGDDGMMTIKPEVIDWFNFVTIKTILESELNLEVTSASKTGEAQLFKNLEDLEFLKRNFIKIGPYYYGKIQETVLDKMLNWTHTNKKHHFFKEPNKIHFDLLTIEASLDSLFYELCIYPPEKYKEVVNHVQPILHKLGSKKMLPSQRDALALRGIPHKLFLSQYKQ